MGTSRWRRRLGVPLALAGLSAALAVAGAPLASAALTTGVFELEGNAVDDSTAGDDWANVHSAQTQVPEDCPSGASACSWQADGALNSTIFTGGGSKDIYDISSWKWKDQSGGLPDKDNLLHSFAARYTDTNDDELLYFGSDRYDNSGDAHQAFWFLQDEVGLNQNGTFSGAHVPGDVLVISEFSNGGTTATIVVYEWDDTASDNLRLIASGNSVRCNDSGTQTFCGIVNSSDGTASPWPFTDKRGNSTFAQGEFFEGGLNLSAPLFGLDDQCFASFLSETRSSTATNAVLKDFVLGSFGQCGSTTVTTPKQYDGEVSDIPSTGLVLPADGSGVQVKDHAVVTVTGGTVAPSGSVTFHICGPTDPSSTALCETGGTLVGTTPITDVSGNEARLLSPAYTITTAGRYCFRAVYSGDSSAGIEGSSDFSATECFLVVAAPSISTEQSFIPNDSATIAVTSGGPPTGTVTFELHDTSDCSGTPLYTEAVALPSGTALSKTVSTSNTTAYPTTSPTAFSTTLTFYWKVTFDSTNANHTDGVHSCGIERSTVTINNRVLTAS